VSSAVIGDGVAVASKFPATRLTQQSSFYLPELDSLRFFAFLAVFICHLPVASHWEYVLRRPASFGVQEILHSLFDAGSFGVDLFFALSAYLITELLMQEKERSGSVHVNKFYLRRILRIWPLYFAFVAGCYLASQFNGAVAIVFILFVGNLTFPLVLKGLPLGAQILWSISLEEQFYLIWPHFTRFLTRASLLGAGLVLWVATIVLRYISFRHGKPPSLIWYFSPARLDPLACGILISVLVHSGQRNPLEGFRTILMLAGIGCWLVASFSGFNQPDATSISVVLAYVLIALGAGAFILAVIGLRESRFVNPWLVYLGRISYGLYIFHATVLTILVVLLAGLPHWIRWPLYPILGLAVTILIAAASYQWFESPFLRLKRHFQYIRSAPE
jgi:peptidoglycan/LPS O-acetylase OafA/YrhL